MSAHFYTNAHFISRYVHVAMLYSMFGLPCAVREWKTVVGRWYTVRLSACLNSKTAWQLAAFD